MNELVRVALVAFFPRVDELPGLAELDVEQKIETLRQESTRIFWIGIVAAAVFFQLSPILTVRRPLPAAFLSPEELDAHAHALASHRLYFIRQITLLLKLVGGCFWGQSPEIRAFLKLPAYPPDPGTFRTERRVARPVPPLRAPAPALVSLGKIELTRGRGTDPTHDREIGKVA